MLDHEHVLVDARTADDAGAVRLPDGSVLLATIDFITPLMDDPATFGAVAAANAVSDVYAMGGRPILALSIACFPSKTWPLEVLGEMLRGGAEALARDGVPVIGGHSVEDPEMKIGYSVNGLVAEDRLWRNSTARPGDRLLLTKRLGTGIVAAAARAGHSGDWWDEALGQMRATNRRAAVALSSATVHAATDISGFGLAGHAAEMARGSGVTLEIATDRVPVLDAALDWARRGRLTRGSGPNLRYAGPLRRAGAIAPELMEVLVDPQTSGGLLLAVPEGGECEERLRAADCFFADIGRVTPRGEAALVLA